MDNYTDVATEWLERLNGSLLCNFETTEDFTTAVDDLATWLRGTFGKQLTEQKALLDKERETANNMIEAAKENYHKEKKRNDDLEKELEIADRRWQTNEQHRLNIEEAWTDAGLQQERAAKAEAKLELIREVIGKDVYPEDVFVSEKYKFTRAGRNGLVKDIQEILEEK